MLSSIDSRPHLAPGIADAIILAADKLTDLPMMGRPIADRRFRQLVIHAHSAVYVLRYRLENQRVVILRAFHAREMRD